MDLIHQICIFIRLIKDAVVMANFFPSESGLSLTFFLKFQEDPNTSYFVVRNLFDGQGLCRFVQFQNKNIKVVKIPFKASFMLELKPLHNIVYYSCDFSCAKCQSCIASTNFFC